MGRPRLSDQPLVKISARVTCDVFDALDQRAKREGVELSALVRRVLSERAALWTRNTPAAANEPQ